MDATAAISRIKRGLGFRTDLDTEILSALNEAQRELEQGKTLPRWLLVEDATLTLLANSNTVNLPDNFLRRSGRIRYTTQYSQLPAWVSWKGLDDTLEAYDVVEMGAPRVAVLRNTTIYFAPTSENNYTLTWDYYKRATALTAGGDTNEWLADTNMPELLIGTAGIKMALDTRDKDALAIFSRMQTQAKDALFKEIILQDELDTPRVLGARN